jgi:hypothetical protein
VRFEARLVVLFGVHVALQSGEFRLAKLPPGRKYPAAAFSVIVVFEHTKALERVTVEDTKNGPAADGLGLVMVVVGPPQSETCKLAMPL